jgi:hypothetical protein
VVSTVIGFILVFVLDTTLRVWCHGDDGERTLTAQGLRVERLKDLNTKLVNGPRAVRPWDVAGSFYGRITSGIYSPTLLSLSEPFRLNRRLADREDLHRKMRALSQRDVTWQDLRTPAPLWSLPGSHPLGFLLGVPDGVIFTIRHISSGGWPTIVFDGIACLCALPLSLALAGGRGRPWWAVLILLPLVTSLCGTVLWAAMAVTTRVCRFLLLPAASVWAFSLPGLVAASQHLPAVVAHKAIEDGVERHLG